MEMFSSLKEICVYSSARKTGWLVCKAFAALLSVSTGLLPSSLLPQIMIFF